MQQYCSPQGAEELANIRVSGALKPTGGNAPIELLARVPSDECGCPEELWRIEGLIYLIHMEEEAGTGEIFLYAGDFEEEQQVQVATIEDLRAEMFSMNALLMRRGEN